MAGWIKLHRKLTKSNMYKSLNSKQRDVMFACLLSANYYDNEWEFEGKIYKCEAGQFISSLDSISKLCANDVKVQSVRTALLKLEKWGFLTNKSTKTGRLITICNWDSYQSEEFYTNKDNNKASTKHQQSSNKELTTNKELKNIKEEKEEIIEYLNCKTGKSFKLDTKSTISKISARLNDGFSVDDFKKVIDIKCSQWLNDSNMSQYLRPETLFGTKFESYLNENKSYNQKPKNNDVKKFKCTLNGRHLHIVECESEEHAKELYFNWGGSYPTEIIKA